MVHVIQVATFAAALIIAGTVLVDGITSPRFLAVLRQTLSGKEG